MQFHVGDHVLWNGERRTVRAVDRDRVWIGSWVSEPELMRHQVPWEWSDRHNRWHPALSEVGFAADEPFTWDDIERRLRPF